MIHRVSPHLLLLLFLALGVLPACERSPVADLVEPSPPGPSLSSRLQLERIMDVQGPDPPAGLEVTADGEYVIASGYRTDIFVLTGEDLTMVNRTGSGHIAGITLRADNRSFFLSLRRIGGVLLTIPGLESSHGLRAASMRAIRDRAGSFYYTVGSTGELDGLLKMDATGKVVASIPHEVWLDCSGFELTPDGQLFVAAEHDRTGRNWLDVVEAESFTLLRRIEMQNDALAIVPLEDSRRALVFDSEWDESSGGSLFVSLVDLEAGTVVRRRRLHEQAGGRPHFAVGNPWTYLPGDIALMGTGFGLWIVDTRSGEVERFVQDSLFQTVEKGKCCTVAYDAHRDRLLISGHENLMVDGSRRAALSAFRIVR